MQQDYTPKPSECLYLANQNHNIPPALKSKGFLLLTNVSNNVSNKLVTLNFSLYIGKYYDIVTNVTNNIEKLFNLKNNKY